MQLVQRLAVASFTWYVYRKLYASGRIVFDAWFYLWMLAILGYIASKLSISVMYIHIHKHSALLLYMKLTDSCRTCTCFNSIHNVFSLFNKLPVFLVLRKLQMNPCMLKNCVVFFGAIDLHPCDISCTIFKKFSQKATSYWINGTASITYMSLNRHTTHYCLNVFCCFCSSIVLQPKSFYSLHVQWPISIKRGKRPTSNSFYLLLRTFFNVDTIYYCYNFKCVSTI